MSWLVTGEYAPWRSVGYYERVACRARDAYWQSIGDSGTYRKWKDLAENEQADWLRVAKATTIEYLEFVNGRKYRREV